MLGTTRSTLVAWLWLMLIDAINAFPFVVLVIAIVAIMGPGVTGLLIGLAAVNWARYARIARARALILRSSDFIEVTRVLGYSRLRVLVRHILPNAYSETIAYGLSDFVIVVLTVSALSFLGAGVRPPTPEWGAMMADGRVYLQTQWWITVFPGLALSLTAIGGCAARPRSGGSLRRRTVGEKMPSSKGLPELEAGAQTSQPAHILEVEGLRISVPRGRGRMLQIVDTADFQLRPHESLGIVGESGSGKTMLCRALIGTLWRHGAVVTAGSILFQGQDLAGAGEKVWHRIRGRRIGYVPQSSLAGLNPLLTVRTQLLEAIWAAREVSLAKAEERSAPASKTGANPPP